MKTFMIVFAFTLTAWTGFGQVTVEDVNINELKDVEYVELIIVKRIMSTKVSVFVDYGQPVKLLKPHVIKDENGQSIIFDSNIHALNFMDKRGWEFVSNNVSTSNSQNVYYYLLKRKE